MTCPEDKDAGAERAAKLPEHGCAVLRDLFEGHLVAGGCLVPRVMWEKDGDSYVQQLAEVDVHLPFLISGYQPGIALLDEQEQLKEVVREFRGALPCCRAVHAERSCQEDTPSIGPCRGFFCKACARHATIARSVPRQKRTTALSIQNPTPPCQV